MSGRAGLGAGVLALAVSATAVSTGAYAQAGTDSAPAQHVLLLSVDGMHQRDLAYYVAQHPRSALAQLVDHGTEFTHARTTFPSDSIPGMVAELTGAQPGTSGVYYDDTYNRALLPPGTRDCRTAARGTEVSWTEAIDRSQNPITLDAGQGLTNRALAKLATNTTAQTLAAAPALTAAILKMTPTPQSLLDPDALPVDPASCTPLYPHDYLRVNTVFDVVRGHHLRTAWSDKHAAYEILNGPSGTGIQDLFTPEVNSVADAAGDDWTKDNALTKEYDHFKVAAVLNEINGMDHSGARHLGTPAIFGMNFQSLSTAQKLPSSDGLRGGYNHDGTPGPLVRRALEYVDRQLATMQGAINRARLADSTVIILSAKHGQSPIDPRRLRRVDDGPIIDAVNAGWAAEHPGAAPLVAFAVDDDGMLWWLSDHRPAALAYARHYLLTHTAPANLITDPEGTYSASVGSSGLTQVATGHAADRLLSARPDDAHAPDLVGIARGGVVDTGGVSKIAEHGGNAPADRDVPLVVSGPGVRAGVRASSVQTTQIAPTILNLLGLDPRSLRGVRLDHTAALPHIGS